ncbi:hypothetical protein KQI65_17535 [bacterium]|nr:hypothetical protein [bacterium]
MSLKRFLPLLLVLTLAAGCSEDDSTLDPTLTDPPIVFTDLELSDFLVDTDTVDVIPNQDKSPDDPVTIPLHVGVQVRRPTATGEAVSLRCTVTQNGSITPVFTSSIDNPAEGLQAFDFDLELSRGDVGDYRVEISGLDANGAEAASAFATLRVIYGSNPPELVDIHAPDSVQLEADTTTLDVSVLVQDASGLKDIKQVVLSSFLPDKSAANGNPFILWDQGVAAQGDEVAGDGWYSRRFILPPTAQKGEYEFQIRAVDYSNAVSNVIIHKIIVY